MSEKRKRPTYFKIVPGDENRKANIFQKLQGVRTIITKQTSQSVNNGDIMEKLFNSFLQNPENQPAPAQTTGACFYL